MSLINEALKKVQSDGGGPATPSGGPTTPDAADGSGLSRKWAIITIMLSISVMVLLFALVAIMLINAWKDDSAVPETAATQPATPDPARTPAVIDPEPPPVIAGREDLPFEPAPPTTDEEPPVPTLSDVPEEASSEAATTTAPIPAQREEVREPPIAETTVIVHETRRPEPPPPEPKPSPDVLAYLDNLEIRGVLSAGQRLLIHDRSTGETRTWQAGAMIDVELGLKIASVEDRVITFTAHDGQSYTKRF